MIDYELRLAATDTLLMAGTIPPEHAISLKHHLQALGNYVEREQLHQLGDVRVMVRWSALTDLADLARRAALDNL